MRCPFKYFAGDRLGVIVITMNYSPMKVAKRLFGGKGRVAPRTLQRLNLAAAVVLALQAIALVILSVTYAVPVYVAHVTGDALQTKLRGTEIVAPALHELWSFNLAYIAAVALLVTALMYVLLATVWRKKYEAWLKRNVQPLRWIASAVAGSLLLIVLALVAGVNTLTDLKSIAAFVVVASLGAAWLELQPLRRGKLDAAGWLRVAVTLVAAVMPLLIVLETMLATVVFGAVAVPGYTWVLYGTLATAWLLVAGNVWLSRKGQGKWGNYANAEVWYTGLIVAVETVFVWVLFAAVLHP